MLQGNLETSCQVLIQLLAPDLAYLHKIKQRLATVVEATAQLASHNINVYISLDAATHDRVTSPEVLNQLAPIIQQLYSMPERGATPSFQQVVTASHILALLPGRNSIKSLSLSQTRIGAFPTALLANWQPPITRNALIQC